MNSEVPPPNRAIGWYRFMLWMMPTCIAITTAVGIDWLADRLRFGGYPSLVLWFVLNVAATLGVGYFDSGFRQPPSQKPATAAARFLLIQLAIGLTLICATAFVASVLAEF